MKKALHLVVLIFLAGQITQAQTSLWATATTGGTYGFGTILKGNPDGTNFHPVFSFDSSNGSFPIGKLTTANNGKIYGVTYLGACDDSCVCFCYDPVTNSVNVLYQFFLQIQYGGIPYAGMTYAIDGKLYGMTSAGGANGAGVIYMVDPATNTYTDVYDFDGLSASNPSSEFLQATDGKLYAVTAGGSTSVDPVMISFDPTDRQVNIVHSFIGYSTYFVSLRTPTLIQASNNIIYGVAEIQDAAATHDGVLFSYDLTNSTYAPLHNFSFQEGSPCGGITEANGKLFGMTLTQQGARKGELFSFNLSTHAFTGLQKFDSPNGFMPLGALSLMQNGNLIGSMYQGGLYGSGTLFTVNPGTDLCTKIFDFNGPVTGAYPMCDIMMLDAANLSNNQITGGGNNQLSTGIQDVASNQFMMYPNPTSGTLYVQNPQANTPYVITNLAGQEVAKGILSNPQQVIDVSKLASGTYLLNKTRFTKE